MSYFISVTKNLCTLGGADEIGFLITALLRVFDQLIKIDRFSTNWLNFSHA